MTKKSEDNTQQTFLEHLEALRSMLIHSLTAVAVMSLPGFYFAPKCIDFIIKNSLPENIKNLHYFSPMEVFVIQLKAGLVIGFILAFPYIVYQVRKFVLPALYENEKKFLGWLLSLATLLFAAGSAFCIFLILPLIMKFSASFSSAQLQPTLGLESFVNLSAAMILAFGLMFQFPLAVLICVKFGFISIKTLKNSRPYIIVGILVLAAIFTPPDIVSQLMLGIPTWLLFEAGLFAAGIIENSQE